jgi:SAM-dependent methyltransferase
METNEYASMFHLEDFYWWFVARRQLVHDLLRRVLSPNRNDLIVDIGCGTGANERVLSQFGRVISIDFSVDALRFCSSRGMKRLLSCNAEDIPIRTGVVDAITILDCLEHVDDDLIALSEMYRILRPGGILLLTVPAYGFLWSEHDEALHHRRRYGSMELKNKMKSVGFGLEQVSFFITTMFFPILVLRVMQSLFKKDVHPKTTHVILPKWINSMLIWILAVERMLCKRGLNLPFGVSLVAIGSKPVTGPLESIPEGELPEILEYKSEPALHKGAAAG